MEIIMHGRGFLDVAREVLGGSTEFHRRAAFIHAYYALFLECRDFLFRNEFVMPRRDNVHAWVRLRFTYATDSVLKRLGRILDRLVQSRNRASYDMTPAELFATPDEALEAIDIVTEALALIDELEKDSVKRVVVIASIKS